MTRPRVYLASAIELPEPDVDEALLLSALGRAGVDASVAAWDDPGVDWTQASLVVLRSTWNYHLRLEAFLDWVGRVARETELWDPASVVRWDVDKRYLAELASEGLRVVPTAFVRQGEDVSLTSVARAHGFNDLVIKPVISAGSFLTRRFAASQHAEGQAFLSTVTETRDVMVQGYVRSVEGYGERAVVVLDGAVSHAVRKAPRFMGDEESVSAALPVAEDERAFAEELLGRLPRDLLYARIDLARDDDDRPMLMELELVEPSLFLAQAPEALERFAGAIATRASAHHTAVDHAG